MFNPLESHKAQIYEVQSRMDLWKYNSQSCPNIFATLSSFCNCEDNVEVLSPIASNSPSGSNPRDERDSGVDVGPVTEEEYDEEDGMIEIYRDEGVDTQFKPLYVKYHATRSQVIFIRLKCMRVFCDSIFCDENSNVHSRKVF